ncbi:MAG: MFS transporter [Betaproteobacteria bacterium]|nr:MFS transporter [Betaproteobacteria bacterium]
MATGRAVYHGGISPGAGHSMSKRTLGICSAVHTLHDGLSDVTYVLLPLLASAFGLSLAQVGLIRGAHRAAMAAFQIPAGLVAERFGERELLAGGTMLAGAAFAALGFAQGYWAILFALFFAGAGSAVQHPLASTLVSRAYPVQGRRAALGTYNFAGDVGKFAFGGTVSLLLVAGVSWKVPVLGFGAVAIVTAIAVLSLLTAKTRTSVPKDQAPADGAKGWGIRDRPRFLALCLIEVLDSSTRSAFLTFIAFLLIAKGLSAGWAVAAVPLVLAGGMVGKLACGVLAERLGIARMIVITEIATAAGIFAALALPATGVLVLLPLLGVVVQGTSSVLYATIGEYVRPERLSRAFGLFYTVGSVCGIAAPLAFGLLGDRLGVEVAIAALGGTILLTLPLVLALRPERPKA